MVLVRMMLFLAVSVVLGDDWCCLVIVVVGSCGGSRCIVVAVVGVVVVVGVVLVMLWTGLVYSVCVVWILIHRRWCSRWCG